MSFYEFIDDNIYWDGEISVIANKLGADVLSHKQYKVESTDLGAPKTDSKLSQWTLAEVDV